jgi:drug/metabolite transporter (DMT)-like permease
LNIRGNIFGATAIFLFALGFPAADQLLQTWGIMTLISLRNFLALIVMIFLIHMLERSVVLRKLPWAKGFLIGGIGFGFGSLLLLIAQAIDRCNYGSSRCHCDANIRCRFRSCF